MTVGFVANIISQAVFQILLMAAPMLGLGLLVGLTISIFQATTSIQEQTLTFAPKLFTIFLVLFMMFPFMLNSLIEFTREIIGYISKL